MFRYEHEAFFATKLLNGFLSGNQPPSHGIYIHPTFLRQVPSSQVDGSRRLHYRNLFYNFRLLYRN